MNSDHSLNVPCAFCIEWSHSFSHRSLFFIIIYLKQLNWFTPEVRLRNELHVLVHTQKKKNNNLNFPDRFIVQTHSAMMKKEYKGKELFKSIFNDKVIKFSAHLNWNSIWWCMRLCLNICAYRTRLSHAQPIAR